MNLEIKECLESLNVPEAHYKLLHAGIKKTVRSLENVRISKMMLYLMQDYYYCLEYVEAGTKWQLICHAGERVWINRMVKKYEVDHVNKVEVFKGWQEDPFFDTIIITKS